MPRADHGDLFPVWRVTDVLGRTWAARVDGSPLGTKLGPFVTDLALSPGDAVDVDDVDVPLALTLGAWQVLGAVERALELATEHVRERHQFGRPLAAFQAVQFQVADATVAVHSLRELCRFTMWRLHVAPDDRVVDALALRVHALECAHVILRTAHQLHGAVGFCDEHDLSILTRHTQPLLRLPAGLEASTEYLMHAVEAGGFASLFAPGPSRGTLEARA
jgi:acyl-CoA dehydrogenase